MKIDKVNNEILEFWSTFDIKRESAEYEVPVYYVLGKNDWQTPYIIAEDYFKKINSPRKKLYLIPEAGHMTMLDQPGLFFNALSEICASEKAI